MDSDLGHCLGHYLELDLGFDWDFDFDFDLHSDLGSDLDFGLDFHFTTGPSLSAIIHYCLYYSPSSSSSFCFLCVLVYSIKYIFFYKVFFYLK